MRKRIDSFDIQGIYFGYPQCCIDDFRKNVLSGIKMSTVNLKDNGTGFIPCNAHKTQIENGEITLEHLISNRYCKQSFPDGGTIEDLIKFENNEKF